MQSLEEKGFTFSDNSLPEKLSAGLFSECQQAWGEGRFKEAHIGRGPEKSRVEDIRGDSILWLNPEESGPAVTRFFAWAGELRQELNRRYFLGLRSEEFHFARYPAGKGYQKHIDQHRGSSQRQITLVLYLNPHWGPQDGGELCIYDPHEDTKELLRILPQGGRLVLFRSDLIPHAVLPCFQTRWSLTGWFRTDL